MKQSRKVLIADDNRELCTLLTDILEGVGYDVDTVYDGYELLAYLENNTPMVIILDLMMPEKDGMSILSTIRQVSPYSRIVIYTGYQEYENSVYARTADRFLLKGGDIEKLIKAIDELS